MADAPYTIVQTSNFMDGRPWSAHWGSVSPAGTPQVCATQGASFVRHIQRVIAASAPASWTLGGRTYQRSAVRADSNPGPITISGAWALAQAWGAPQSALDTLQNEYTQQFAKFPSGPGAGLGNGTMNVLAWLFRGDRSAPYGRDVVPSNAIPLQWGKAPPADPGNADHWACWDPTREQPPAAQDGTQAPTPAAAAGGGAIVPAGAQGTGGFFDGWSTGEKWAAGGAAVLAVGLIGVGIASAGKPKAKRYYGRPRAVRTQVEVSGRTVRVR